MINISVSPKFKKKVKVPELITAAEAVLSRHHFDQPVSFSIVIEEDTVIQRLNHQFMGEDKSTDVLSFPTREVDPDNGQVYLGDIVISYPFAEAQAIAAGHAPNAELELLVVHGVLHLFGHDHLTIEEKEEMWALQKEILLAIGSELNHFPE